MGERCLRINFNEGWYRVGFQRCGLCCGEVLGLHQSGMAQACEGAGRECLPEVALRAGVCSHTHTCVYSPTELYPELPGSADRELTELLHGLTHRHGL